METSLAENLEKKRVGLSMAYEAVMTSDAARMLAYGRNKNRRHEGQIALMQGMEIKDQQIEDEDEMFHVGDVTINQIMPGSSSSSATAESKATPTQAVQSAATGLSTAGKVASAIAVGAGLLGLGATGPGLAAGAAAALTNAISVQVQGESVPQGESSTIETPVNP